VAKEGESTKEIFESILDSMEGGVLAMDKDARITFFNHSAEEITGYTKEEASIVSSANDSPPLLIFQRHLNFGDCFFLK